MQTVVALGSNCGDRRRHLNQALQLIAPLAKSTIKMSSVYSTPALLPENPSDDWNRPFLNMAIQFETELSAELLLKNLKDIEQQLGRKPAPRWAPREIDLDIIDYGKSIAFVNGGLELFEKNGRIEANKLSKKNKTNTKNSYKTKLWRFKEDEKENKEGNKEENRKNKYYHNPISDHSSDPFDDHVDDYADDNLGNHLDDHLIIPHPLWQQRNFVVAPIRDLQPSAPVLALQRSIQQPLPAFAEIINVTPDSFSDGGQWGIQKLESHLINIRDNHQSLWPQWIDFGAESTRPNATPVDADCEWQRLRPAIEAFHKVFADQPLCPKLSIDTRSAATASKCIEWGAEIINDVSGLTDASMLSLLQQSSVEYVLMHSLSVPADPKKTFPTGGDAVEEICQFFTRRLQTLTEAGVATNRIYIDPGVGFGKTPGTYSNRCRRIHYYSFFFN